MAEPPARQVTWDDSGVRCALGDGRVDAVVWSELEEVRVVTTATGPLSEDVFFVLVGEGGDHGCVVGMSEVGEAFVPRLQALPGFRNEELIRAMGSAEEAEFLLWRRTSPG